MNLPAEPRRRLLIRKTEDAATSPVADIIKQPGKGCLNFEFIKIASECQSAGIYRVK